MFLLKLLIGIFLCWFVVILYLMVFGRFAFWAIGLTLVLFLVYRGDKSHGRKSVGRKSSGRKSPKRNPSGRSSGGVGVLSVIGVLLGGLWRFVKGLLAESSSDTRPSQTRFPSGTKAGDTPINMASSKRAQTSASGRPADETLYADGKGGFPVRFRKASPGAFVVSDVPTVYWQLDGDGLSVAMHLACGDANQAFRAGIERSTEARRELKPWLSITGQSKPFDRTHLIPFGYHGFENDPVLVVGWDADQNRGVLAGIERRVSRLNRAQDITYMVRVTRSGDFMTRVLSSSGAILLDEVVSLPPGVSVVWSPES